MHKNLRKKQSVDIERRMIEKVKYFFENVKNFK